MLELREQGLSNAQIALEMGLSKKTVFDHIGPLGKGKVARHGSLVTHAQGESFVNKDISIRFEDFRPCSKRVEEEEKRLKIDNPCVRETVETHSYKGRDMVYTITKSYDDDGCVQSIDIYHDDALFVMTMDQCQQMIMELLELIG